MPDPVAPVLEIDGLGVRYGPLIAVRDLDLTIHAGEVVGLIGPNGAGKSSTLAAVMGVVEPSHGDIRLRGRSVVDEPVEARVRMGLALVPEGRHIFPSFTVYDNLRLGMMGRRDRSQEEESLQAVFDLFPVVKDFRNRLAGALSGGQQQQVAVARALVSDPDLLLLDEPSLGLAPAIVSDVMGALEEIRTRGVTILLVEQRAQMTVAFADRTHVLRDGKIVLTLGPEDADDIDAMTNAYFGR